MTAGKLHTKLWNLLGKPCQEIYQKCLQVLMKKFPSMDLPLQTYLKVLCQCLLTIDQTDGQVSWNGEISEKGFSMTSSPVMTKSQLSVYLKDCLSEFETIQEGLGSCVSQRISMDPTPMSISYTTATGIPPAARMSSYKEYQSRNGKHAITNGLPISQQNFGEISSLISLAEAGGKSYCNFYYNI